MVYSRDMKLVILKCLRCGWEWPRVRGATKDPETCANPKCRSPYWQTPRKRQPKNKAARDALTSGRQVQIVGESEHAEPIQSE